MIIKGEFERVVGDRFIWYVPVDRNPSMIFVDNPEDNQGFFGATLQFNCTGGKTYEAVGAWNSNEYSLKQDTGISL